MTLRDFSPWVAEPLLLGKRSDSHPASHRKRRFVLTAMLLSLIVVVVGGGTATLMTPCKQLLEAGFTSGLLDRCAASRPAGTGLLGDVWSAFAVVVLGVTTFFAARQWRGYASMMSHMSRNGSLEPVTKPAGKRLKDRVDRANRLVALVGKGSPFVLTAFLGGLIWYATEQGRSGTMGVVAHSKEGALRFYNDLWLTPHNGLLTYLVLMVVVALGLYVVTIQNAVGAVVIWTLWTCRKDMRFGADTLNADGYYGWLPVRQILDATYAEIGLHGLAIAAVSITLPPGGLHLVFWFVVAEWALTLPLYFIFPVWFARTFIKRYREATVDHLVTEERKQIKAARNDAQIRQIEVAYAARIQSVHSVPALPFRRTQETAIFLLSISADFVAVAGLLIVATKG